LITLLKRCLVVEEGGEEEEVEARMEVDMVDKEDKEAVVVKGKSKVVRALEEATRHLRELGERVREARVMKIDVWSVSTRWRSSLWESATIPYATSVPPG